MASGPNTSWQIDGETMETVTDFMFLGSKITEDGDCRHEIKRCLLLASVCHPILLLPPIPPSIRVFPKESTLHMRWPKYWSFSFSIIPSKEHPGLISNLDSLLKTSDITLPTKVHLVKAMVFSVVMYGCETERPKNWCFWTVVLENSLESLGLQGDPTSPS